MRVGQRTVGTVLDVEDLIPFSYTLEVSSPGLDRKLVKETDYTRFEGKLAKIQTRIPLQHQKIFRGRLRGLQGGNVLLELPKGDLLEIPLDVIQEARLEFDWAEEKARGAREGIAMSNLLFQTIDQISREKGIDPQIVIHAIEDAIVVASRKYFKSNEELRGRINPETGEIDVYAHPQGRRRSHQSRPRNLAGRSAPHQSPTRRWKKRSSS